MAPIDMLSGMAFDRMNNRFDSPMVGSIALVLVRVISADESH